MYDNSLYYAMLADKKCDILKKYGLQSNQYILSTIHRDNNTDNSERLTAIFEALVEIAERDNIRIVLPLHPRTSKRLPTTLKKGTYERLMKSERILMIPPASFFEIIVLEKNARVVMTDSGGVQKEAFFFERPCVILRPETEWVEIVEHGAGIVADADKAMIISAYEKLVGQKVAFPKLFGDAQAAKHILTKIIEYLK